jgi:hypothetical protein
MRVHRLRLAPLPAGLLVAALLVAAPLLPAVSPTAAADPDGRSTASEAPSAPRPAAIHHPTVVQSDVTRPPIDLVDGACRELNSCQLVARADGTAIVEAWGHAVLDHSTTATDRLELSIEAQQPVDCAASGADLAVFEVAVPRGNDLDIVVSLARTFRQRSGEAATYRLSGRMTSGRSIKDQVENSRMICTFIPD